MPYICVNVNAALLKQGLLWEHQNQPFEMIDTIVLFGWHSKQPSCWQNSFIL